MLVIGHRGARGLAPENTLASLQKALDHDVDMAEFDVRVTKDGVPVLHHNLFVVDGSGNRLRISAQTYAELKAHDPDLATLEEALNFLAGQTKAYIEVKFWVPVEPVITVLKKFAGKRYKTGDLLLASKSQKTLRALHTTFPDVPLIVIEPWSGVRASWRARQLGANRIAMNQLWLWSGFIRAVSRNGRELYAYTLNDPKKAAKWQRYGLKGVITDFPDRFEQ